MNEFIAYIWTASVIVGFIILVLAVAIIISYLNDSPKLIGWLAPVFTFVLGFIFILVALIAA